MTKLQRIPENQMMVVDTKSSSFPAIIEMAEWGIFSFEPRAIYQIISGSTLIEGTATTAQNAPVRVDYDVFNLLARLSVYAMDIVNTHTLSRQDLTILVKRSEMETLKSFLEARIRHCEMQRDQENPEFNADTYISQKLLLLDIREWLMVYSFKFTEAVV